MSSMIRFNADLSLSRTAFSKSRSLSKSTCVIHLCLPKNSASRFSASSCSAASARGSSCKPSVLEVALSRSAISPWSSRNRRMRVKLLVGVAGVAGGCWGADRSASVAALVLEGDVDGDCSIVQPV